MTRKHQETILCQICKEPKKLSDVLPGGLVHSSIVETIRKKHPDWSSSGFICLADLNHFRTEYVQDVLEEAKGEDVNAKDDQFGWTALMYAATNGHTTVVEVLLDKGADVNATDTKGRTALMLAVQNGRPEIVQLLEKAAAKE